MTYAHNGKVRLFYESLGDPADDTVVLIAGAGRQSIDYPDSFCQRLVDAGLRVVRIDSRDVGASTAFTQPANLVELHADMQAGRTPVLAYDMHDMAADVLAVMDAAGLASAHIFARSLGVLAAELIAIEHPERVKSLTLVMAFSRSLLPSTSLDILTRLDAEHIPDEETFVSRQVRGAQAQLSPEFFDEPAVAAQAAAAWRRGVHPGAMARLYAVGLAAPDLRPALAKLKLSTLVIHGRLDKTIPVTYAEETAAAVPGAKLVVIEDMSHATAAVQWDRCATLFLEHVGRG